jgi:hypothetical protein
VKLEGDVLKIGSSSKVEECPTSGSCTRVLASHEESDHDVGNLLVREGLAGLVLLVLECGEHVEIRLDRTHVSSQCPSKQSRHSLPRMIHDEP